MNILAGADFHGDHDVYQWFVALAASAKPDAVVLAGDLFGYADGYSTVEEAQRADSDLLAALLESLGVPVLYIMGNDDQIEMVSSSASVRPLHMASATLGSYRFVGYQFSLPFMGGVFEQPEEKIAADLAELQPLIDEGTILVTHSPAYGVLDTGVLGRNIGSRSIRELIVAKQPRAHIHGHCHAGFGREGGHFNVASARQKRAMIIDLETLWHRVVLSSADPRTNEGGTPIRR